MIAELIDDVAGRLLLALGPTAAVMVEANADTVAGPAVVVGWSSTTWSPGGPAPGWLHDVTVTVHTSATLTAAGHYPRRDALVAAVLDALRPGAVAVRANPSDATIGDQAAPAAEVIATYRTTTC